MQVETVFFCWNKHLCSTFTAKWVDINMFNKINTMVYIKSSCTFSSSYFLALFGKCWHLKHLKALVGTFWPSRSIHWKRKEKNETMFLLWWGWHKYAWIKYEVFLFNQWVLDFIAVCTELRLYHFSSSSCSSPVSDHYYNESPLGSVSWQY